MGGGGGVGGEKVECGGGVGERKEWKRDISLIVFPAIGQLKKLESEQKACEEDSKVGGRRRRSHYPTAQQQPDAGRQQGPDTARHEVARSKPVAPAVRKPAVNLLAAVDEAYNVTNRPRPHVGGTQTDVGGAQTDVGGAQDEADGDETIRQIEEEKQVDSTIVDSDSTGLDENMDSTNILVRVIV